jgi:hypothetical protein
MPHFWVREPVVPPTLAALGFCINENPPVEGAPKPPGAAIDSPPVAGAKPVPVGLENPTPFVMENPAAGEAATEYINEKIIKNYIMLHVHVQNNSILPLLESEAFFTGIE